MTMKFHNLFVEDPGHDVEDRALVELAARGDREALERLVLRHQAWIYNIVLRMTHDREDAEDETQEVLIKIITKLSTFEGRSGFRTWLYRIVVNHVLNMKRGRAKAPMTFTAVSKALDDHPDLELPDPRAVPVDVQLLVTELKLRCMSGMLLCLDPAQRLVYVFGQIFGASDRVGGELLEISPENFRQARSKWQVSRATGSQAHLAWGRVHGIVSLDLGGKLIMGEASTSS